MKHVRYGVCKVCKKKFKVEDDKFYSIQDYWSPQICRKCRQKQSKGQGEGHLNV